MILSLAEIEIWGILRRLGGLGLILLGILDSSVIPTPGGQDVLTILLSACQGSWWVYYASMAVVGSVVGGYLTFRLGRLGGHETLEKKVSKERIERVNRAFERWGFGAVMVPALFPPPLPLGPFLMAAGAMNYSTRKFLIALTAARILRFGTLAYLSSLYGSQVLTLLKTT